MSSWTALTWYTAMKTAFKANVMKSEYYGIFIVKGFFLIFRVIEENVYLKKYSPQQQGAHKIGF